MATTSYGEAELRKVRMGEAIKACVVAEGGWMDWAKDGKVRFLRRREDGLVGAYFSETLLRYISEHRDDVKVFIDFERKRNECKSVCA